MSSIGPDLPPHLLAKRKRQAEQQSAENGTVEDNQEPGSPNGDKRRRVMGPAMPPASLNELPRCPHPDGDESQSSDDDDDEDDYGPSLHLGRHPDVSLSNMRRRVTAADGDRYQLA
jgi:hypothetical protein